MKILWFPTLFWPLPGERVCARVLGLDLEVVASSLGKARSALARQIQRDEEEPVLEDARLDVVRVAFRPSYVEREAHHPTSHELEIPVVAAWGANPFESYTCYLPLLDEEFVFYDPKQIDALVRNFARNRFQEMTPEQIHRQLVAPDARLDSILVRSVRERRRAEAVETPLEALARVADRHPWPRRLKRKIAALPEVAWERGELAEAVRAKLAVERVNVLLVGDPGVGKSAILLEAIRRMHATRDKEAPVVWRTSPRRLIAGARWLGEWQQICDDVAHDLRRSRGILWLDGFVELLRAGGEGPEDSVAAYLTPYLDRGEVQIVSEATPRELEAARAIRGEFVDRFQIVRVDELSDAAMRRVLDLYRGYARTSLRVEIETRALETSYRLLRRFVRTEKFPGKAMRFLGASLNDLALAGRAHLSERQVLEAFGRQTGLPEMLLRDDLLLDAARLRTWFAERILGQEDAVDRICRVVQVFKAGLQDPGKPIATLLFAGPTGVGKTASARALARYFFGAGQKRNPLVRLDMSEFQHPAQIGRLIGSPGNPGLLVRSVRERPFSVVLLDEIEKAHPAFFDALLAVLDEGVLADAWGRVTDFRTSILVLTTNLGTRREGSLGFGTDAPARVEGEIRQHFRPEFYNRLDQVVVFRPLDAATVRDIARKELAELGDREGFRRREVRLEFSEALVDFVSAAGFDAVFGARPLQRSIERHVVGTLARHLLAHPRIRGVVRVDVRDGKVIVEGTGRATTL